MKSLPIPEIATEMAESQFISKLYKNFPSYPEMGAVSNLDTFPIYAKTICQGSCYGTVLLYSYHCNKGTKPLTRASYRLLTHNIYSLHKYLWGKVKK